MKKALGIIKKLKALCDDKTRGFHDERIMSNIQKVLTPQQLIKLLAWVDDHSEELKTAYPQWETDQFLVKSNDSKE